MLTDTTLQPLSCHKEPDFETRTTHLQVTSSTRAGRHDREYKSLNKEAAELVFTERGGLPLTPELTEPIMGGTKLCLLLLVGTYALAREYKHQSKNYDIVVLSCGIT